MGFRGSSFDGIIYHLKISSAGTLYESSKEPKEGFVAHYRQADNSLVGYWKEHYNGLVGYLNYIGLRTVQVSNGNNLEFFSMTFKDYETDESFNVSIPTVTSKGKLNRFVKDFVKYFKNIDYSRQLVFGAFRPKPSDEFGASSLYFAYPSTDGERDQYIERYFKKGQNGWPDTVKVMGFGGKETTSCDEQDRFAYTRLTEYIQEFNSKIPEIRRNLMAQYGKSTVKVQNVGQQQQAPAEQFAPEAPKTFNQQQQQASSFQQQQATGFAQQQQGTTQAPQSDFRSGVPQAQAPQFSQMEETEDLPF